ncbi:hypothetical protein [Deinococcus arcticus]|uniref:Uncharacterized protein n=1 Tax=Deinococcus arcticus TaxID=2136176 RepID=A0A2T3W3K8_9DEIO|nr:hypothetical protein [Deinococcus arcticus]PTA66475.1 hypothetical protein C8263_17725 [Deinococcus arcticus]
MKTEAALDLAAAEALATLLAQVLAAGGTRVVLMPRARPLMLIGSPPGPVSQEDLVRVPGHGAVKASWMKALIAAFLPGQHPAEARGETLGIPVTLVDRRWLFEAAAGEGLTVAGLTLLDPPDQASLPAGGCGKLLGEGDVGLNGEMLAGN